MHTSVNTSGQSAPPSDERVITMILADDERHDFFFFDNALKELSIPVFLTYVQDGVLLLDYFEANKGYIPDVIFMDMHMPRKTGMECLAEVKLIPWLSAVPVVMYSTSDNKEEIDMLHQLGAHYYMDKSSFSKTSNCIRQILTRLASDAGQPHRDTFVVTHCPDDVTTT